MAGLPLLLALAGCGSSGVSGVRIIHTSPGNGALDAFVSDDVVASNLPYGMATAYVQVSDGSHTVSLTPTGQDNTILQKQSQDFINQSQYTIFAVNPGSGIGQLFLLDNNTQPTAGDCKIRVVNVSPANSVVDVYVVPPSTNIATVPATLRNLAYSTASQYLQLAAQSYDVVFTPPGSKTILANTAAVTLADGDINTVALADAPGGGTPYQAYDYVDAMFSNNNPPASVAKK